MKCYVHLDKDAVGVCVMCGRGICEACAVNVGGKLYCKQDLEKQFALPITASQPKPTRHVSITVASILFFVFGALGIIGSVIILAFAPFISAFISAFQPLITPALAGAAVAFLVVLGVVYLILSILDIVAGYWLWFSLKKGGMLGIVLCIISIALSFIPTPLSLDPTGYLASLIIGLVFNLILIMLIAIGWETLK